MAPIIENNGVTYPFPAIAIPLLRKDRFECPEEHIDRLKEMLPKLTHLLLIGWRGVEDNFLDMIRGSLNGKQLRRIEVVSGNERDGEQVIVALRQANIFAADSQVFGHGFTAFTLSRKVGSFLKP